MKCPGQDPLFWDKDAIFEAPCPSCGRAVEFFKDDPFRRCPACGYKFQNPRLDIGCAEWCPYAEQCLGSPPGAGGTKTKPQRDPPEETKERGHGSPVYVPGSGGKNLTPAKVAPPPDGRKDVKHLKDMPQNN